MTAMKLVRAIDSRPWLVWCLLSLTLSGSCAREETLLRLATTTSVDNSGLLDAILPAFRAESGIDVQVMAVGSGRALQLLRRGDADIALTHDADAEEAFIREGRLVLYRKLMFNDFLIVGPVDDPAAVRDAPTAADAMRRIARSASPFVSRGDASGTHAREQQLWNLAGVRPPAGRLLETGQGMAATLRVASEREGYCLTDRATFLQLAPALRLARVFEGGVEMLNTYAIIVANGGAPRCEAGKRLVSWLAEGRGRRLVEEFAVAGAHPFTPWPVGRPADTPRAAPR